MAQHHKVCCTICLLPRRLSDFHPLKSLRYAQYFSAEQRAHSSCLRLLPAEVDSEALDEVMLTCQPSWPMSDDILLDRARRASTFAFVCAITNGLSDDEGILARIAKLPHEIIELIGHFVFPSFFSRCLVSQQTNLLLQSLVDSNTMPTEVARYVQVHDRRYITKHLALPVISDQIYVVSDGFGCTDIGPASTRIDGRHRMTWHRIVDGHNSSVGKVTKGLCLQDIQTATAPVYWDSSKRVYFDESNCWNPWQSERWSDDLCIRMRLLSNRPNLSGITIATAGQETVGMILHHESSQATEATRRIEESWPRAIFQFWALYEDSISDLWVRTSPSKMSNNPCILLLSVKGQRMPSGPHLSEMASLNHTFHKVNVSSRRPDYIAINDGGELRLGAAFTQQGEHDDTSVSWLSIYKTAMPRLWGIPALFLSSVNVNEFETYQIWYHESWGRRISDHSSFSHEAFDALVVRSRARPIRGILFTDHSGTRAVLGQWKATAKLSDPAPLAMLPALRNHCCGEYTEERRWVAVVDDEVVDDDVRLQGVLNWWAGVENDVVEVSRP